MNPSKRLFQISDRLKNLASKEPVDELANLEKSASEAGKAWSGSWLGYHSRIYYDGLKTIPPGARFSKEWGLKALYAIDDGTVGDWFEYDYDEVINIIKKNAGVEDLIPFEQDSKNVSESLEEEQSELLSIITPLSKAHAEDVFMEDLVTKIRSQKVYSYSEYINIFRPSGQQMTRDSIAIHAGLQTPPHFSVLATMASIRSVYNACGKLEKYARRLELVS